MTGALIGGATFTNAVGCSTVNNALLTGFLSGLGCAN